MPPKVLRTSEAGEVTSPSFIEANLTPTTKVMIFSGIAAPELRTEEDDETLVEEVIVKLGVYVASLDSWTAQVGLASVENDESRFVFATDNQIVDVDPQSELQLRVNAVVNGDKTILHRFSYQVVARVTKVASQIEGTIRIPPTVMNLANKTMAEIETMFRVQAQRIEKLPPSDPPPLVDEKLIPVADGKVVDRQFAGQDTIVKYVIEGCPFNTPLRVTVNVNAPPEVMKADQIAGPKTINLTSFVPAVSGIDFAVVRVPIP